MRVRVSMVPISNDTRRREGSDALPIGILTLSSEIAIRMRIWGIIWDARARSIVEQSGMAKEMSSNLFRMFQFGVEDRRTCRGEYKAGYEKDYRIIRCDSSRRYVR